MTTLLPNERDAAARTPFDRVGIGLVVAAIVAVFFVNLVQLADFDIFLHLAVGEWIVEHREVPRTGLFSATRGDAPWVDNEWGFQVLAATANRLLGIRGLVLLSALLPTIAAALVAFTMRRRGMPWIGAALGVGLVAVALGPGNLRPQMITSVGLAAFLWGIGELGDRRSRAPVVILPLLAWVWANLHGGFIVGLAALAIPIAVEALRRLAGRPPGAPLAASCAAFALSAAAVFVNPYGWRQVVYPIEYVLRPAMTAFNLEWQPTVLADRPGFALLLAAAFAALALSPRRPTLGDLALVMAFSAFALKAYRHIGLASLVVPCAAAPSAAALVQEAIREGSRVRRILFALGTGAFLLGGFLWVRGVPAESPFHFDRSLLIPLESADFLAEHHPPGRLFNQYGWGSFLAYRFRPEAVVFVDGRNDLYREEFMAEYLRVMAGEPDSEAILDRYGIGHALVGYHPNNARLIRRLLEAGWVCVHRSRDFVPVVILVRSTPEARPLIEKSGIPLAAP